MTHVRSPVGHANRRFASRAEAGAAAKALRDTGLTGMVIAERLGVASTYVYELLSDPSGERVRARKARHRKPCPGFERMCGRLMDGSNGGGPHAARLCLECAQLKQSVDLIWTREAIIEAVRYWAVLHGRPPVAAEWLRAMGGDWPSASTVQERFGKWADAIEAAGFPRPRVGQYQVAQRGLSLEDVIAWGVEWLRSGQPFPSGNDRKRVGIPGCPYRSTLQRLGFKGWPDYRSACVAAFEAER